MTRHIGFLIFPDFQLLDAAGPIAAFEIGGVYGHGAYALHVLARTAGRVASSSGASLEAEAIRDAPALDTLVIAGGQGTRDAAAVAALAADVRALAAMDEAFHVAVAQASHNRVLAKMVMTLHHQTARFWLNTMREPSLDENRRALSEHRALADAIASRDGTKAREAMRQSLGDFPSDIKRAWGTP